MISVKRDRVVVAVFGSSLTAPDDPEYAEAQTCGRLLAESGYAVATGGYGGSMEAVSRGAAEAGGHVIGVTDRGAFPDRGGPNRWVMEEWAAASLTERIHGLIGAAVAAIALPGSIGTFAELVASWYVAQTASQRNMPAAPIVAVGAGWASIIDYLAGALDVPNDTVIRVDSAEAAVAQVRRRVPFSPRQDSGS